MIMGAAVYGVYFMTDRVTSINALCTVVSIFAGMVVYANSAAADQRDYRTGAAKLPEGNGNHPFREKAASAVKADRIFS